MCFAGYLNMQVLGYIEDYVVATVEVSTKKWREKMNQKVFVTRSSLPPYEEYVKAIKPLWESHWITNMGHFHQELEERLKGYLEVSEISLMVNGHMALELAIQAFDFPKEAEVITTPFTFVSTTHAIIRNHLRPVFCDVKIEDGTIDENKIEELITKKTVAIVPVHVYGNICQMEVIEEIAKRYNLKVIYDAAHAFGVKYKGEGIGNYGNASVFSFHATKVYNTIEGGAVTFSEHTMYEKLYNLKNFGIRGEELVTDIGANAKLNEFAAVMGLCNLKYIDKIIEERKKRYEFYWINLKEIKGIRLLSRDKQITSNYAYLPVVVEDEYGLDRDRLYACLRENGIYSRKYFYPLTADQACFGEKYKSVELVCARELSRKILVMPLYEELEMKEIRRIVNIIKNRGLENV